MLRRSPLPPAEANSARPETQALGLTADLDAALAGRFVSGYDLARHVGIGISADDFPPPLFFSAMPRLELHRVNPMIVHARSASVASGVAGAIIVSTSPVLKSVAMFIEKV